MYINPFWVGVGSTILAELALIIVIAIWADRKK